MIYLTKIKIFTLNEMKLMSWFDLMKNAMIEHQKLIHTLFLRNSISSHFVTKNSATHERKKSNRHLSIKIASYLKQIALCETKCICFRIVIELLSSNNFWIKFFKISFKLTHENSKFDVKLLNWNVIKHLIMRFMYFTIRMT